MHVALLVPYKQLDGILVLPVCVEMHEPSEFKKKLFSHI
jgi:hypothetical protein